MPEPNHLLRAARERTESRRTPGTHMSREEAAEAVSLWLAERDPKGREVAFDAGHLGKLERGVVGRPRDHYVAALCAVLGATEADLGLIPRNRPALSPPDSLAPPAPSRDTLAAGAGVAIEGEVDDVKRMEFVAGLLASIASPGSLLSTSMRVGMDDIRRYRTNLEQLYALDDTYGASNEVYSLSVRALRRLLRDFNQASYTPRVGQEIRAIAGQLTEHAGWLAFDSGKAGDARYWWLEALHAARMTDNGAETEIVVLASMSANASRQGKGREAVDLAVAARRLAKKTNLPRLNSLLCAREALGHARAGDATPARRAMGRAHKELDKGRHEMDPLWLDFWGESDLACHESTAARFLGDLPNAEDTARQALATVDADKYPRNHAMYLARLAQVLAKRDAVDEAVQLAAAAAIRAVELHSRRLIVDVELSLEALSKHQDHPAARELVEYVSISRPYNGLT